MGTSTDPLTSETFHHFADGLEKGIKMQLDTGIQFEDNLVKLELNLDGIPIFKSPPTGFWPILGRALGCKDQQPFLCSAFCGPSHPPSVDDFLQPIIDDVLRLQENGMEHHNVHYDVELDRVVCDTPGRALAKCVKGHAGT